MYGKWVTASAVTAVVGFAGLVEAAPVELVGYDVNGDEIKSGWTYEVPESQAADVALKFIRTQGDMFFLEKDANIRSNDTPITISFNRVSDDAKTLVINDEAVRNSTGVDWIGFRFMLSSNTGETPAFAFRTSDGSPGLGGFNIDPFTNFSFVSNNSELVMGGGTVRAGTSWFPGSNEDPTGLAIVAGNGGASSFTLKEIPIPIPLPAGAWMGLTSLAGLGTLGAAKRLRRSLA